MVALTLLGGCDMVSVIVRHTLVQLATPDEMRGRVSAVNMIFIGASNELGQFESGLTAQWFGIVPAVVLGGIGTMAVVAAWAWLFPELRKVDELTTVGEKPFTRDAEAQRKSSSFFSAPLRLCVITAFGLHEVHLHLLGDSRLEASAAARLVHVGRADYDQVVRSAQPLRVFGRVAAAHADRQRLGDRFRMRQQIRHGRKGRPR